MSEVLEQKTSEARTALVVGATGISGGNLAEHLVGEGWMVYGLSRKASSNAEVRPVLADLGDAEALRAALAGIDVTHVFVCTWSRQATEAENVRVNGAMIENLFRALEGAENLRHAALVTGTKQYLGPFESYGQVAAETPFRETSPRLPGLNFYYTQEDVLIAAAKRGGFSWSVHRPHSMIGYALGNAMNMGVTLAVYATICRERGETFVFPGSKLQWNALTDVTDATVLAEHLEWAATSEQARDKAFNIVNGDVFRWRWLWPQLAEYFGVAWEGPPEGGAALAAKMKDAGPVWREIAERHGLAEADVDRLASWWHTDGDLGRELECVNDMTRSRLLGFEVYLETVRSFVRLFDRLKAERIIPG